MDTAAKQSRPAKMPNERRGPVLRFAVMAADYAVASLLGIFILYLSLIATSVPVSSKERAAIDRAIDVLYARGFTRDAFLLRHAATFRTGDNWINDLDRKENAYAATNFPFGIITLYPDFYTKAEDDTERAMVLLHEARHMQGADERQAYAYVWQNRARLGWTTLTHGSTPTYITIDQQTRENVPELFTCSANLWSDCTEPMLARR
jgi:hypothetical protein